MAHLNRIFATLLVFVLTLQTDAFTLRTWDEAYTLANDATSKLTTSQKLGIVSGVGQFGGRCVGETHPVTDNTQISIPPLCFQDGPAGLRLVKNVTGFPSGINTASTFSRRLMRARGAAMAEEARAKGVQVFLGPAIDISRNPKGGRNWESFGPDPYLAGEGAFETVTGVQSTGVQACAKHLNLNNQEHWRYGLTANIDDRTMHELYFYPYVRAIEADVSSVMCAYNRVNGTSSCHNANMIGPDGILRKAGFKGYVVSDWGATHDSATDNANAGLDMEMPGDWILIGGAVYSAGLQNALNDGSVKASRLDEMITRILAPWYKLGQDTGFPDINFDAQKPDGSGSLNLNVNVRSAAHTALVREIGAASAVLLKNNRVTNAAGKTIRGLPLAQDVITKIAIVGQDAKMPKLDCSGGMNTCNEGTVSIGWGSGSNSLDFIVPPIDAIKSYVGTKATIEESLSNDLTAGPKAAAGKDLALVFVNAMSGELGFYTTVEGNQGDRNDLDLWWKGGSLVERVAAVCNNTVVIVHSVGPVALGWTSHPNITAVIYAGAPGEQTGPSLVDVLSGAVNPSGRLPFTIDEDEDNYGNEIVYNSLGFPSIDYTEKLLIDYRYMDANNITPHFEFGYGLSYTNFTYTALSVSPSSISFTIKNTGGFDGTEIPQLYLGYPTNAGEPPMVLRGFDDIFLKVGESKTVTMSLIPRDYSIWDTPKQACTVAPGTFQVYVGASIKDIRLKGQFTV